MSDVVAPRRALTAVNGVLLLDKASGITSNRALQQVRYLYGAAKAGHTGTLDPLCSGLLPVCFGEATKFSGFQLNADKRYRATIQLGVTTTTGDAEGEVLQTSEVAVSEEQTQAALVACRGPQFQIPPMYSALKRDGKPLYEYARAGVEVVREARAIEIYQLIFLGRNDNRLSVEIYCSKGTYIRVLAEKIGELLGCGAHLAGLRRVGSGDFELAAAATFDQLLGMEEVRRQAVLLSSDSLLQSLSMVELECEEARRFALGQTIERPATKDQTVRVYGPDFALLGIGVVAGGRLAPKRLVANPTVRT